MRTVAIAVGAAVLLVAGLAAAAATIGLPGSMMAALVQDRIARETGFDLAVNGRVRLSLRPQLHVALGDVALSDRSEPRRRLAVPRLAADLAWSGLFSGAPKIQRLVLDQPVWSEPLTRTRKSATPAAGAERPRPLLPDEIVVTDGAVVLSDAAAGIESRIEGLRATVRVGSDQRIDAAGEARLGGRPATFSVKTLGTGGTTTPVEAMLDAPGLLPASITARADLRRTGSTLAINGLSGALGDGPFTGWASIELTGKPLVKLDLDFQRLDWPLPASGPLSETPFDAAGFNYVDAQLRLSAAELTLGQARLAPAVVEATLDSGLLTVQTAQLGAYGGKADGALAADFARAEPAYSMRLDLDGVAALPLLSSLAGFEAIDGRLQAKIAAQSRGNSARAIVTSASGNAFVRVTDGEIRGLNLARMIRALTTAPLSGWQDNATQSTDLNEFAASFAIARGEARTGDLALAGPLVRMTGAGTIDLVGRTLSFRVEPKLVMTTQGQGGAASPVGLGVPVVVEGPWTAPRIYPDVAGILDNPDAAYARLRQLGAGLFGGIGGDTTPGGALGETLGALIQQGLGAAQPPPAPGAPRLDQPGERAPSNAMDGILKQLFGR